MELTSGQLTPHTGERKEYQPQEREMPLRLRQTAATLKEGATTAPLRPLWLESPGGGPNSLSLVTTDAEWDRLSPRGDVVLYVTDGVAWVLPLLRLPREKFTQARDAALRAGLISNAKQLALGLIMYHQDHHTLPRG